MLREMRHFYHHFGKLGYSLQCKNQEEKNSTEMFSYAIPRWMEEEGERQGTKKDML